MATVSKTDMHDYHTLRLRFADGMRVATTWSRGGMRMSVTPSDPGIAERLSLIYEAALDRMKEPGYPFRNLGEIVGEMERIAASAKDVGTYVLGLEGKLDVRGIRPPPRNAASAPAEAQATMRRTRGGWQIDARFPNGETFALKLNEHSMSWRSDPMISSRDSDVMNFLFGVNGSLVEKDRLAEMIRDNVLAAPSLDEWLSAMRAEFAPAPRC